MIQHKSRWSSERDIRSWSRA